MRANERSTNSLEVKKKIYEKRPPELGDPGPGTWENRNLENPYQI